MLLLLVVEMFICISLTYIGLVGKYPFEIQFNIIHKVSLRITFYFISMCTNSFCVGVCVYVIPYFIGVIILTVSPLLIASPLLC